MCPADRGAAVSTPSPRHESTAMYPIASPRGTSHLASHARGRNAGDASHSGAFPGPALPMLSRLIWRLSAWCFGMVLMQVGMRIAPAQGVGPAPQPALRASDEEPIFRLEADGPSSLVTGLAFAPDGQTLYVAGWDKIVRVWTLDRAEGKFQARSPRDVPSADRAGARRRHQRPGRLFRRPGGVARGGRTRRHARRWRRGFANQASMSRSH